MRLRSYYQKLSLIMASVRKKKAAVSRTRIDDGFSYLFAWKRSIYKLLWMPFLFYSLIYIVISYIYDFLLDEQSKLYFEGIAIHCSRYASSMPLVLLLGFFTSTAMARWFAMAEQMPGTSKIISMFICSLKEDLDDGTTIIQQFSRWTLLTWTLTFRQVCKPLKKFYPDFKSLQDAGLLLHHERKVLELEQKTRGGDRHLPLVVLGWSTKMIKICHRKDFFITNGECSRLIDAILVFKKGCGRIVKLCNRNIPLALIQIVTIAVYGLVITSLMARNVIKNNRAEWLFEGYLPLMHAFPYFLYLSWLKFGVMATDPFGEDDDDFNVAVLLQEHIDEAIRLEKEYTDKAIEDLINDSIQILRPNLLGKIQAAPRTEAISANSRNTYETQEAPGISPV